MRTRERTTEFLLAQCARWPGLQVQDLLKGLHQSAFGCGHFVTDEAAGLALLRRELTADCPAADVEPLDGPYCRVHLGYLKETGLAPETLFRLFRRSAEAPAGDTAALEERLTVLQTLAEESRLPFDGEEVRAAVDHWRREGFPACHHSPAFRAAHAPAYRVIRREFLWLLPLLSAIDRRMAETDRAIVALEGGSASGKTTLAALLADLYGCTVFHMDDFFLRPEQRTAARLAEPGGNVDRERFAREVLAPLKSGGPVAYRRYDCHTQTLLPPVEVRPTALTVVEGAYSMHPDLADSYDLSAFLAISPEGQRARIRKRNDPDMAERFFSAWIPMEQRYFDAMDPASRCSLILKTEDPA